MKKIVKILQKKKKEIKRFFEKTRVNENWHTRYNNLEKKYSELEKNYKKLEKKLDRDKQNQLMEQLKKDCLNYKRQRDILREKNKELVYVERVNKIDGRG